MSDKNIHSIAVNGLRNKGKARPIRIYATPFLKQVLSGLYRIEDDGWPTEKLEIHDIAWNGGQ